MGVKSSTAIRKNRSSASVAGFSVNALDEADLHRLLLTSMGEIRRLLGEAFSISASLCGSTTWDPMELRSVHGIERFSPEQDAFMISMRAVLDNESDERVL